MYAIDRLRKNTIGALETVEAIQSKGVAVLSIREGFDSLIRWERQCDHNARCNGIIGTLQHQGASNGRY
ncbi:hypothetical protein ACLUEY_14760 [Vreelandella aquamarina]